MLEKGRVKEVGTPRELVDQRGLFWRLCREGGVEGRV